MISKVLFVTAIDPRLFLHHRVTLVLLDLLVPLAKTDQRVLVVMQDPQEDREMQVLEEPLVHKEKRENPEKMDPL